MNCLVTGSTGFLGKHLLPKLSKVVNVSTVSLRRTKLSEIELGQIDSIVHLAGLAHQMQKIDPKRYFDVNKDQTLALAQKAKDAGVKHFIFISTVKVYGDNDIHGVLNEDSECHPSDPYGQSKRDAEIALQAMENEKFTVSIIRPPLIYGAGVKGNLDRIINLAIKLPILPFGNIQNERSMVYAGNVSALIQKLLEKQTSGIFIAGDKTRKSTTDLVNTIIDKMNLNKANIAIPGIIRLILRKIKPAIYHRLFNDFIIDNSTSNERLQFTPPYSFEDGIANMVSSYLNKK